MATANALNDGICTATPALRLKKPSVAKHGGKKRFLVVSKVSKKKKQWEEGVKVGVVDYDQGKHDVQTEVIGLGPEDAPKRYRRRLKQQRQQRDWTISRVVAEVLKLNHWDDIDNVLNHWSGRFHRKNFPLLIQEICKAGALEHSVRVFNWMKNQQNYRAQNDIYNLMIRLHARHNRTDQARGLFFEMQEWRCKPDVETYNALINVHGRAGQWRWSMNIFNDMLHAAVPPSRSSYNNLINACGCSGQWEEALKGLLNEAELVFNKMKTFGCLPNVVTYTTLIHAYGMAEMWEKAHSLFEDMEASGIKLDSIAYSTVMSVFNRSGQPEKVLHFAERMRRKGITFGEASYFEIISACSKLRDLKTSGDIMEELEPSLANLSIGLVNHILRFTGKSGKLEQMMKIFYKLEQSGIEPTLETYCILLDNMSKAGKWRKCVEILNWLEISSIQPSLKICKKVLACLEKQGNMEYIDLVRDKMRKMQIKEYGAAISKDKYLLGRGFAGDDGDDREPWSPISAQ